LGLVGLFTIGMKQKEKKEWPLVWVGLQE